MENFVEFLVKKKRTGSDTAKMLFIILALLFIVCTVSMWIGLASGLVILAFGGYGAWFLVSGLKREYEYSLTNDHLDVDEIVAQRSRRRLCGFDMEAMELCARVSDPDKKGELNRKFAGHYEAASAPDAGNAWFAVFSGDNGVNLLIFEPNEKLIEAMSMYARSKIFK